MFDQSARADVDVLSPKGRFCLVNVPQYLTSVQHELTFALRAHALVEVLGSIWGKLAQVR